MAGLFLAMGGVAYAIASRNHEDSRARIREGLAIAAAAFIPPAFLSLAFPEGGYAPFPFSAFLPIPLFVVAASWCSPADRARALDGAILYGLGAILALAIETPMGRNAARLGALFGGPVLLCALWGKWPLRRTLQVLLLAGFCGLAVWQWGSPVGDVRNALTDPAADADYFEPLRQFLATLPDQRRIEIPFTRTHWEGAEIAPQCRSRAAGCASSTPASTRSSTRARSTG